MGLPASGSSSTGASTGAGNPAPTSTPLVGRVNQFFGPPIAGPDGSYFTPGGNGVNRYGLAQVFPNGRTRILHEFNTLKDFNPVDDVGYNYDGYADNELVYASDGNRYLVDTGGMYARGPDDYGCILKLTPDGEETDLHDVVGDVYWMSRAGGVWDLD